MTENNKSLLKICKIHNNQVANYCDRFKILAEVSKATIAFFFQLRALESQGIAKKICYGIIANINELIYWVSANELFN